MKTDVIVDSSAVLNSHQFITKPGAGQKPEMVPRQSEQSDVPIFSPGPVTRTARNIAAAAGIAPGAPAAASGLDDSFVKSNESPASGTATYTIDAEAIAQMKAETERHFAAFRQIVKQIIEKQGYTVDMAISGEVTVEIDAETRAEAQAQIADDGYWGVDQTAGRILDFAKALSGGDPSKIETLRGAFVEGFEQAKEAFGGELPEISQKTYDKVMQGFDEWQKGGEADEPAPPESVEG